MKIYEEEAIRTALHWNQEGFNKRNKKISVDFLNFPHIRIANKNITIHNSPEEFLKNWDRGQENLDKQGWDHTDTLSIKPVQSDKNKVHLLLHQSRINKKGLAYLDFQTLWIVTKINNKWGIQFRSSFLIPPNEISKL